MNNTLNTSRRARRPFSVRATLAAALVVLACGGCALDQPLAGLGNIFGAPAEAKTADASNGRLAAAQRKVAEGADAKALRKELSSVLVTGGSCGNKADAADRLEAVRFLLDNGVGINQKNGDDQTPLEEVLFNLSWEHWHCGCDDDCAAIKEEMSNIAMLLVSRGANMNIHVTDAGGRGDTFLTALGAAVQCDRAELVKLMIEKGAKVNAVDKQGQTALQLAQENGNQEIISMLKSAGAGSKGKKGAKKRQ